VRLRLEVNGDDIPVAFGGDGVEYGVQKSKANSIA
jgi:hypothetical protein